MNSPILIVGAGPSGLTLALSLLQNGVPVRIIDKEPTHRAGERGAGMMPRTFELHNLLGTLPDILNIASKLPKRRHYELYGGDKLLFEQELGPYIEPSPHTPYSNPLIIGQNHLERLLREHLKKYGVEVELATALEKFEQFDDYVTAHLVKTVDGESILETAKFPYLVGTDGARSVVRKQLGLSFLGETVEEVEMKLGDIVVEQGLSTEFWQFWGDFKTKLIAFRASGQDPGVFNFFLTGVDLKHVTATSGKEDLFKAIKEITGKKDLVFGEIRWLSDYRPNIRMVDKFHVGRVLIAGDAAHCHSPTGGQGMNSSSQDSINLGWKLALVAKGLAPPSLLDTYDEERIPVIKEMLNITTKILKQTIDPKDEKDRRAAFTRGQDLHMLGVNCRASPIVVDDGPLDKSVGAAYYMESATAARAGDRAPDAPKLLQIAPTKEETSLFGVYGSSYHTVLVFGGSAEQHKTLLATVGKMPNGVVKSALVVPSEAQNTSEGFDIVLVDTGKHAAAGYSTQDDGLHIIAVRPDGVVGARVSTVEGLNKYFSGIFL